MTKHSKGSNHQDHRKREEELADIGFRLVALMIDRKTKIILFYRYEYNPPLIEEMRREEAEWLKQQKSASEDIGDTSARS